LWEALRVLLCDQPGLSIALRSIASDYLTGRANDMPERGRCESGSTYQHDPKGHTMKRTVTLTIGAYGDYIWEAVGA